MIEVRQVQTRCPTMAIELKNIGEHKEKKMAYIMILYYVCCCFYDLMCFIRTVYRGITWAVCSPEHVYPTSVYTTEANASSLPADCYLNVGSQSRMSI